MTPKQQIFVNEYLKCWNATEAARRAGYEGNENTLSSVGYENLRKPDIDDAISRRLQENAMSADEVLMRLADQARGDVGDFVSFQEGLRLPIIDLAKSKDKTHLIKKIKYGKDGQIEFELYDAQSALVHLGKAHGLFTDKVQVSGPNDEPIKFEWVEVDDNDSTT